MVVVVVAMMVAVGCVVVHLGCLPSLCAACIAVGEEMRGFRARAAQIPEKMAAEMMDLNTFTAIVAGAAIAAASFVMGMGKGRRLDRVGMMDVVVVIATDGVVVNVGVGVDERPNAGVLFSMWSMVVVDGLWTDGMSEEVDDDLQDKVMWND